MSEPDGGRCILHICLAALALLLYGVHLGGVLTARAGGALSSVGARLSSCLPGLAALTPCFPRQAQKVVCLAALAFGSPIAATHLQWANAVDLALLLAQFVAQEFHGGAPVDDVALALPLDLCSSFVLLGVAQNRMDVHFSWVVANLVMSISVSTIPLVFGHKLPRGTARAPSRREVEDSPGALSRNSSNDRSTLNGPSTVTDSSVFNSRRSSLHMPAGHLTAAQLESFIQCQGGSCRQCHSQCGSSASSVVEQLQAGNTPRVTAKPLHRLDRITLPAAADEADPASALIMRSSGMAIEMLDRHGRCMHYTSRVRRQRVYIKTGVGSVQDARLQQLLPRVQHTLLAAQGQVEPRPPCQGSDAPEQAACAHACPSSTQQGGQAHGATATQLAVGACVPAQVLHPPASRAPGMRDSEQACAQPSLASRPGSVPPPPPQSTAPSTPMGPQLLLQQQQQHMRKQRADGQQDPQPEARPRQQGSQPCPPPLQPPGTAQHDAQCRDKPAPQCMQPPQQQPQPCSPLGAYQSGIPHAFPPMHAQQLRKQASGHRPVFGGVYVRDGCVEMTLDVLSFDEPPTPRSSRPPSRPPPSSLPARGDPALPQPPTPPLSHAGRPAAARPSSTTTSTTSDSTSSTAAGWPAPPHALSSAPASLPLEILGPGDWLDLMGLAHTLQPAPPASRQPHSCLRGAPTCTPAPPSCQASRRLRRHSSGGGSSSAALGGLGDGGGAHGEGAASVHFDPYLQLQLGEQEAVRMWRLRGWGGAPARATPRSGAGNPVGTQQLQAELQEEAGGQQWQQVPLGAEVGACARAHQLGAPATPQLLGAYPSVLVADPCSISNGKRADGARVHLYVLLPVGAGSSGLAVSARHCGRYLPVRVLSSQACGLGKWGGAAGQGERGRAARGDGWAAQEEQATVPDRRHACTGPGAAAPALVTLEAEVAVAALRPGLVHFEVRLPGTGAPSLPACVLVVGAEHAGMAVELQQLQPRCKAQAQQEAALLACRHQQEQPQPAGGGPAQQHGAGSGSGGSRALASGLLAPCGSGAATYLLPPTQDGACALLHDLGVWLELQGAAAAAAAPAGASSAVAVQPPAVPCCAAGCVDLSVQFVQGMACTCASMAAEVDSLVHHLATAASLLGWTRTAHLLLHTSQRPPSHSQVAAPAAGSSPGASHSQTCVPAPHAPSPVRSSSNSSSSSSSSPLAGVSVPCAQDACSAAHATALAPSSLPSHAAAHRPHTAAAAAGAKIPGPFPLLPRAWAPALAALKSSNSCSRGGRLWGGVMPPGPDRCVAAGMASAGAAVLTSTKA